MGKRVFFWNRIYCGKERFWMKGDSMGLEELISYLTTSEEIEALWPFATVICILIMQFFVKRDKGLATRHAVDSKSEGLGLELETEEDDSDIGDEEALEPWDAETEEDSSCPSASAEKLSMMSVSTETNSKPLTNGSRINMYQMNWTRWTSYFTVL